MINGRKVLAWIPARRDSKRIANKNIKTFCGKPLLSYTIEAAKNCKYTDEVFVSTNSSTIAEIARNCGASVPFLRPDDLAQDSSKTIEAVIYSLEELSEQRSPFDVLCLLQPTSPLRTTEDIERALEVFVKNGCESLASVSRTRKNSSLMRTIESDPHLPTGKLHKVPHGTLDEPSFYEINGAIYINEIAKIDKSTDFNNNSSAFILPPERSVDINTALDFKIAEFLYTSTLEMPS